MTHLKNLLTELVGVLDPYKKDLKYAILATTDEDGQTATAFTVDGQTYIRAQVKDPVPEIKTIACLGSIAYLKSILDSSYMKNEGAKVTVDYRVASDGKTEAVASFTFTSQKMKVAYEASDPLLVQALTIAAKKPRPVSFVATIPVDKETAKEFEDAARIYAAHDNTTELCRIDYSTGQITAEFGERGHRTQIVLASDIQGEDTATSATYMIEDVKRLLRLAASKGGSLAISGKYLKLSIEQDAAEYSIMVSSRKVRAPA